MRALPALMLGTITLSMLAVACGTKNTGEVIRPNAPTFNEARGPAPACHDVQAEGTPLIVDWEPEERGDLEVAMKQGVAVVHYDCKAIKLLQDCKLEGSYAFVGMNKKEQVISIENADQAQANLPLHGATLGAGIKSGAALNIGLVMIGKKSTTIDGVERAALVGKCEGATHFVHSAMLGAFAMKTASVGEVGGKAVVDVFGGAGASASSTSNHAFLNKDGDLDACKQADADNPKAPSNCGALLRVRLLGISEGKITAKAQEAPKELACPTGLVATGGKCGPKVADAPHDCQIIDTVTDCAAECEKGSGESCGMASLFYSIGLGDAQMDAAKSADFAKKGCDKEDNFSCDSVADALLAKEKPKAIELYRKTCYGGYDQSCRSLGKVYADDGDGKKAARFYQRACDSGDSIGCLEAAKLYSKGMAGLKADPAKAVEDWRVACLDDIVIVDACYAAGLGYEKGTGVDADATRAKALYRRACDKDHAPSCTRLKKL